MTRTNSNDDGAYNDDDGDDVGDDDDIGNEIELQPPTLPPSPKQKKESDLLTRSKSEMISFSTRIHSNPSPLAAVCW